MNNEFLIEKKNAALTASKVRALAAAIREQQFPEGAEYGNVIVRREIQNWMDGTIEGELFEIARLIDRLWEFTARNFHTAQKALACKECPYKWNAENGECQHGKQCPDYPLCKECPFERRDKCETKSILD